MQHGGTLSFLHACIFPNSVVHVVIVCRCFDMCLPFFQKLAARSLTSLLFSSRLVSPWFELEQISGLLSGKCSWRLFPRAATSVATCTQVGRRVHRRDSGKAAEGLCLECMRVVLTFWMWFRCARRCNTSQDCVHVCDVWDASGPLWHSKLLEVGIYWPQLGRVLGHSSSHFGRGSLLMLFYSRLV